MFAVTGWKVSPNLLKKQSVESPAPAPAPAPANGGDGEAGDAPTPKPSKKRKRNAGTSKPKDVNSTNLADLWETVIEGKEKVKKSKTAKAQTGEKRQRVTKDATSEDAEALAVEDDTKDEPKEDRPKKGKTLKEKRREKKAAVQEGTGKPENVTIASTAQPVQIAKPVAQLTPLQAAMRQKLVSARFRHLNQTLYTTPSAHSLELFQQNPEMFQEYHEGFRRQVEVWPENPVDGYVMQIRQRGMQRRDKRGLPKVEVTEDATTAAEASPLPRTEGRCTIADLGCGDAGLAQGLQKDLKKLNVKVHSFDLQNPSPLVTKADIANLPLEDGTVDIAIFCLALMGTNWVDFIEEAFRILRWKGELWVAEIKSRFGRVSGKQKRVEHSVGNRKKPDKKALQKMEEEADDADLMVEVDGHEDRKGETDVSAFVEVLRKRGFVLQNEKAVDLSNRMFVKMHFVKGLTPIKGKCVPVPKGMAEMGMETWKKKPKGKFIEEDDVPISSEASVLKPCVYKLR
ncbi:25S rRNA (adenine(645)-N(1))-methyltransferase [Phlyctema vagabunda]|uniref:Ribosomal RNA-processing protein 8 n=1 Tax=Phlyctema vagabunda TaxID=108571 RepID=A0ABR4P4L8_9HELO